MKSLQQPNTMILFIFLIIITPLTAKAEFENQTGNETIQQLQFIQISENIIPPDPETITRCMTNSLIMRKECSEINNGLVIDFYNNWWVLSGSFFAAFGMVRIRGWYTNKNRSLILEGILYGIVTVGIVSILIISGVNMYIINLLIKSSKYTWVFVSFAVWGAIISYIGDTQAHGQAKNYKIRELDLLTRLRSQ